MTVFKDPRGCFKAVQVFLRFYKKWRIFFELYEGLSVEIKEKFYQGATTYEDFKALRCSWQPINTQEGALTSFKF